MDSYLHVYVRSIELDKKAVRDADSNIGGTADVYCEVIWGNWRQITTVSGEERGGITETEPIILENAEPDDKVANGTLVIQVWDSDNTSSDDFIAAARIEPRDPNNNDIPLYYGQNLGERKYELWNNPEGMKGKGDMVGHITLDQIHFIKQKLMPYRGCKFQCCCCDSNAPACCCLETAKSLTYRAKEENKELLQRQEKLAQANVQKNIQKQDSN